MRKLIKIKKDISIVFSTEIGEFLNPDEVYLPIKKNYHLLVKPDEEVLKGQVILENNLNKIISPVSGVVKGTCKKNFDGQITNSITIANDFKEKNKIYSRKRELKVDKDLIVSKLYEFYFKYIASVLESKKINHLIISGIEDEPYIANNSYVVNKYVKEILEIADVLSCAFNISDTIVAMKSNDTRNIEKYLSKIGTYPNITLKLVDDKYLLGKPFFLLEYLNLSEHDSLVIDARMLLDIYYALKHNRYPHETFITISGPCVSKSKVIKVKVGTLLKDVINEKIKLNYKDNKYILNGLMTGFECDIEKTVVTKNTLGVVIIPDREEKEHKCINCGLCFKVCPVKVNPKKVMDTRKISNNCIDCGLCSYVCPSYINLRKFLRGEYE